MPYIRAAVDKVSEFVTYLQSLDDAQKKQIITIAAVVAAIGPALMIIGEVTASIGSIVSMIGSLTSGVGSLLTSFGGLQGVLAALTGPIGIVVAAVAALAAGFAYLFTTNEEFRESVTRVAKTLKDNHANTIEKIKPKIDELGERFNSLMTTLAPVFEGIFTMVVAMVNGIISTIEPIVTFISGVIEVIMGIFQTFFSLLTGDWEGFWAGVESIIKGACNIIEGFMNAGTDDRSITSYTDRTGTRHNLNSGSSQNWKTHALTGNRGSITARNWFGGASHKALEKASVQLQELIDRIIANEFV